jgi:DNA polymerase
LRLHLDFETRSACNIKKAGAVRYAMDTTTEVLCAVFKFDGEDAFHTWRRGDPPPIRLIEAVRQGATVVAHNAMFELAIWTYVCEARMGWGKLSPHQMDCTMARAHVMSLMGSLDGASTLMRVDQRKDKVGYAIMLRMCTPRKPTKDENPDKLYWNEDFEDFERLYDYCRQDVATECALDAALPQLSASERDIYHFDLVVNFRGFRLDTELMRKADAFLDVAKLRVDAELNQITDGAVPKATQLAKLKTWMIGRGIPVESMAKGDIEDIIDHARIFEDVYAERAVNLRRLGAKATSLAKYGSGLRCVGFDERARGLLNYHKASTGRWAGSLYQPHNLERIDPDEDMPLVEQMIHLLRNAASPEDAVAWCELSGLEPMRAIGKCTRAMIVAAPGHELIGCDYSNVEGRASAWLANETWKLDAFRAYDAGTGPDLYKLAYSKSFGEPVETIGKGPKRQIGKVQELALGFQGAVGAFMSMGANYGVKPGGLLAAVKPAATVQGWETAAAKYQNSNKFGLDIEHWTAFRYVVDGWRSGHPKTVQCWWDIQDGFIEAVANPGEMVTLFDGKIKIYCQRNRTFLYMYLPSGRPLAYFRPRLKEKVETITSADGDTYERARKQVVVEGWDSRANKWGDVYLYGGMEWENAVQALSRDLLVHGMMNCERAGYPVVLHVHDEGVYEVPEDTGDTEEIKRLMAVLPAWAKGFPLTSAAWRDRRYVK